MVVPANEQLIATAGRDGGIRLVFGVMRDLAQLSPCSKHKCVDRDFPGCGWHSIDREHMSSSFSPAVEERNTGFSGFASSVDMRQNHGEAKTLFACLDVVRRHVVHAKFQRCCGGHGICKCAGRPFATFRSGNGKTMNVDVPTTGCTIDLPENEERGVKFSHKRATLL
jgi:hypothetical protein